MTTITKRKVQAIGLFVLDAFGYFIMWNLFYFMLLYKPIPGQTRMESLTIYSLMIFEGCLGLLVIFWRRKNRWTSAVLIHAIPFGVYTMCAYWNEYFYTVVGYLSSTVCIAGAVCIYILDTREPEFRNRKETVVTKKSKCIYGIYSVFAVAMVAIMLTIAADNPKLDGFMSSLEATIVCEETGKDIELNREEKMSTAKWTGIDNQFTENNVHIW